MLQLVFDTKASGRVYVQKTPDLWQNILLILLLLVSVAFFFSTIYAFSFLASLIGSLVHKTLAIILYLPLLFIGFLVGVILVALIIHLIRFKILTTYCYMTLDEKEGILEVGFKNQKKDKLDLKKYSTLVSENIGDEVKFKLKSDDGEIDLSDYLTQTSQGFERYGWRGRKIRSKHLVDEQFASWLMIDLVRDNKKIEFQKGKYLF